MSIALKERRSNAAQGALVKEVFYSLCPGPLPSHIAVEFGWTGDEIAKAGGKLSYLRAIPDPNETWPHVGHRSDSLIREGGNHPPIWARADISDTKVVATIESYRGGGQILVRTDSDISRLEDLKGRKIGLIKGRNTKKIDFIRVPAHRGILTALRLGGLKPSDVSIVDIEVDDFKVEEPSRNPEERANRAKLRPAEKGADVQALAEGKVDAIFGAGSKTLFLERTGKFKAIADLGQSPDWTINGVNVSVVSVSSELAESHPELIVAWLRAAIRGGKWVHENREAAADIFGRVATHYPTTLDLYKSIKGKNFIPTLSAQNLAGLEIQKNFLFENGYIKNNFAVADWVDGRFLEEALATS